ncbi:MAG: ketoacyl-ACP synthase III [Anaerolineales bacterium]
MTRYAHITGWGMAVPEKVLTNHEITQFVDTSDEWIQERTGIRERRIASPEETTGLLATQAALKAMEVANVRPTEVDMIIVATSSPEHLFPATACLVQDRIGATNCGAFDILAACSGFIYALDIAAQAIKSGSIKTALVIGAETLSRLVNWRDRTTCILFGDGAGAFVLQASDEPGGVLSSMLRSDGSGGDLLTIPAGGSYIPASPHSVGNGLHFIQMNGREVFRFATRVMAKATEQVVEAAGLKLEDIQLIVPHQANFRIIEAAARGLKLPLERFVINVERYGNTSTASIPIALCEAIEKGRIHRDNKIVIVGFGAGLTWGAATIHWTGPFPSEKKVYQQRYQLLARARSVARRTLRRVEGWIYGQR